jgi:hypothetical protein
MLNLGIALGSGFGFHCNYYPRTKMHLEFDRTYVTLKSTSGKTFFNTYNVDTYLSPGVGLSADYLFLDTKPWEFLLGIEYILPRKITNIQGEESVWTGVFQPGVAPTRNITNLYSGQPDEEYWMDMGRVYTTIRHTFYETNDLRFFIGPKINYIFMQRFKRIDGNYDSSMDALEEAGKNDSLMKGIPGDYFSIEGVLGMSISSTMEMQLTAGDIGSHLNHTTAKNKSFIQNISLSFGLRI